MTIINQDIFKDINNNLQDLTSIIDLSKKITDQDVAKIYAKAKSFISKDIMDLNYKKDQIYRRNTIDLNCERHKKIFNRFNVIPKFCFGCFKVVIYVENIMDLIKLSIIFDKYDLLDHVDRKCMINYSDKTNRGYIYCSSIKQCQEIAKKMDFIIKKNIGTNFNLETKRGCSEYSIPFPNYKEIKEEESLMMQYPKEWRIAEEVSDQQNFKDGVPIKRNKRKSTNGFTLSDFLIINKWIMYSKEIDDFSVKDII